MLVCGVMLRPYKRYYKMHERTFGGCRGGAVVIWGCVGKGVWMRVRWALVLWSAELEPHPLFSLW